MSIKSIDHYAEIKTSIKLKFFQVLDENVDLKTFLYEIIIAGGQAYIVGGFIRDVINDDHPRDLDLIVDLPDHILNQLIHNSQFNFHINRMKGIKLNLGDFHVDLWSIDNNWAFRENLVKRNDEHLLESLASGCFYNFDAVVANPMSKKINAHHYNNCIQSKTLDILQKNGSYKLKNPTVEANILRAFYIRTRYDFNYSSNCLDYLYRRLEFLDQKATPSIDILRGTRERYPKYQSYLTDIEIKTRMDEVLEMFEHLNKSNRLKFR